jgi:transcriptional regulator with XRE-family HTH domain
MATDYEKMLERFKRAMNSKNLSIKKLANMANVPYGTLYKVFSGETKEPSINLIIKAASALDVTADYLIFGKDKVIDTISANTGTEKKLLTTFRSLNEQGQEYIMQTMDMVKDKYIKSDSLSTMENAE